MIEFTITSQQLGILANSSPEVLENFMKALFWQNFKQYTTRVEYQDCEFIKVMVIPQKPIPTYQDRKQDLDAATENLFRIVQALPGMTAKELAGEYPTRFRHTLSTYDNKLRKLRADGRVRSEAGSDGLLRWYPI